MPAFFVWPEDSLQAGARHGSLVFIWLRSLLKLASTVCKGSSLLAELTTLLALQAARRALARLGIAFEGVKVLLSSSKLHLKNKQCSAACSLETTGWLGYGRQSEAHVANPAYATDWLVLLCTATARLPGTSLVSAVMLQRSGFPVTSHGGSNSSVGKLFMCGHGSYGPMSDVLPSLFS